MITPTRHLEHRQLSRRVHQQRKDLGAHAVVHIKEHKRQQKWNDAVYKEMIGSTRSRCWRSWMKSPRQLLIVACCQRLPMPDLWNCITTGIHSWFRAQDTALLLTLTAELRTPGHPNHATNNLLCEWELASLFGRLNPDYTSKLLSHYQSTSPLITDHFCRRGGGASRCM